MANSANVGKTKTITFTGWLAGVIIVSFLCGISFQQSTVKTWAILIGSLALSPLLVLLLTLCFGRINYKNGIWDYIVGDEGKYSLSRFQAVLWAIIIIAFQLETIVALISNRNAGFHYYEPILSESSVWLLGLSLTSYVAVKGITVNNVAKRPWLHKYKLKPSWSDLLTGENGLDFSRCQMLIWTLIAVAVYLCKCFYFIDYLHSVTDTTNIPKILNNMQDEYAHSPDKDKLTTLPFVPFLPWSFIVLMGLSQGTYIGKKLVPNFKVNAAKAQLVANNNDEIARIDLEINSKQKLIDSANPITTIGQQNIKQLQSEVLELQSRKAALKFQLMNIKDPAL